jgi:predicted short-subunit dehydrogenase-like oxidoreductase (DUF2520 family)
VTTAPTVVVGRGRLGRALAAALREAGVPVRLVAGRAHRTPALAGARVVVLAVPDPAIPDVASRLAPALARGTVLLHTAGRVGPDVLRPHVDPRIAVGVWHPLVSLSARRRAGPFAERTIVCDGDVRALAAARRLVAALGAQMLVASVHGPAYHAAAALLAGGAVSLLDASLGVLVSLGVPRPEARRALAGLLASVAANLDAQEPAAALTGPFARGDAAAVTVHREALFRTAPDALRLYDAMAPTVLALALRAGLGTDAAANVSRALVAQPGTDVRGRSANRRATPRAARRSGA